MRSARFLTAGLACLCILAPWAVVRAGEYKYPNAAPELVVTLPEGWKVAAEKPAEAQLAMITTPQDANYGVTFMASPASVKAVERDALLIGAAHAAAAGVGMTGVSVSGVTEEKMNHGLRTFAMIHASGKINGTNSTFVFAAFTLKDGGRYFLLGEAGPDASLLAHKAEFQMLANSIQPVGP